MCCTGGVRDIISQCLLKYICYDRVMTARYELGRRMGVQGVVGSGKRWGGEWGAQGEKRRPFELET